ncbi:uncharacterized protein [Macrobrachium rosenbergii]|uniref:uncharacterized protein n=1 Tax=Macrobrachium rosenbergii TaxID=79674 RepID=UPI0034D71CA6
MDVNNLRHPSAFLKVVEIVILIIIMALYFSQFSVAWMNYATSVFVGCFLNALVLLVLRLLGYNQIQNTPLELMFYVYYVVSLFISAILLFSTGNGPFIAAGFFCLFIMLVYFADWYYAFIGLNGHPPQLSLPGQRSAQQAPSSQSHQSNDREPRVGLSFQSGYQQHVTDSVDAGLPPREDIFHTNPTYPSTMNYPPIDIGAELPTMFTVNVHTPTHPQP